ncbi:MAG: YIP1 family protein [Gemmobacter sp.]|jgi:hypothetical protein
MAVTSDIVESWKSPRAVFRRHLARGRSEAFAFSLLFVFLLIALIAQYPMAARKAFETPEAPISAQMFAIGLGLLATIPFFYGLAALSRLVARLMGGKGDWYGARMALFWALVTITPLVLLTGLVGGMIGPGTQLRLTGAVTFLGFLAQWLTALRLSETGDF